MSQSAERPLLVYPDRLHRLSVQMEQMSLRAHEIVADTEEIARVMEKLVEELARGLDAVPLQNGMSTTDVLEKRFEIGPRQSYADVVQRLVGEPVFSLDEAYETIRHRITTDSKRVRDGLRQSLDRDERFRRLEDDDGEIYYQRVEQEVKEAVA